MKKIKVIITAAMLSVSGMISFAQTGIGVGFANSISKISVEGVEGSEKVGTNGFYIGADYDIRIFKGLSVRPGIYYTYLTDQATEQIKTVGDLKVKEAFEEHFLNVPVHVKYSFRIIPDVFHVYLFAGPTFDVGFNSVQKISVGGNFLGKEISGNVKYNYYTGKMKSDFEDNVNDVLDIDGVKYNRLDVLLGGGIGIQAVKFLDVKIGYDYGLVDRFKPSDKGSLHRGQFYAGIGIRF